MESQWKVTFESRSGSGGLKSIVVIANSFADAKAKGWKESGFLKKHYAFLTAYEVKALGGLMMLQLASTGYNVHKMVTDKNEYIYTIGGL